MGLSQVSLILFNLGLVLLVACAASLPPTAPPVPPATPVVSSPSGSIQVKGSDTMVNMGSAWAEAFMQKNPKVSLAVLGGGSGTGIAALINKTTNICQASRAMKSEEISKAQANGVQPKEIIVAYDGIALIVHRSNPVEALTFEQLAAIYTSKVTNWKEVGGKEAPIVALSRDTNSGTHVFFKEHVVQYKDKKAEYGPQVLMMAASKTGVDEVENNPNAIFYVGLGYVTDKVKLLPIKKDTNSPGVLPNVQTVQSGAYPVARPLFFYTNGEPVGVVKVYIDWVLGPEGQEIARKLDFVPLR